MAEAHAPSDGDAHAGSHLPVYKRTILKLALLTGVEFGIALAMKAGNFPFTFGVLVLIGLAAWKAVLVARYFMHVKDDPGIIAFLAVLPVILGSPIALLVGFDLLNGPNLIR